MAPTVSPVVVDSHGSVTMIVNVCCGLPIVVPPGVPAGVTAYIVMVFVPASSGLIDVSANSGAVGDDVNVSVVKAETSEKP